MRHHHEISPRDSWNYVLTIRHHHETFMELRPDHTKIIHNKPNIRLSCIPISYQYLTNHPIMFHTNNHTKLLNAIPIVSYRIHIRHHTWLCKVTYQPINTINLAQAKELSLRQEEPPAQATRSRLGEIATVGTTRSRSSWTISLKREAFA